MKRKNIVPDNELSIADAKAILKNLGVVVEGAKTEKVIHLHVREELMNVPKGREGHWGSESCFTKDLSELTLRGLRMKRGIQDMPGLRFFSLSKYEATIFFGNAFSYDECLKYLAPVVRTMLP